MFRSRKGTSIRLLSYDGQGYWLALKSLPKGRFTWWPESSPAAKALEAYAQLLIVAGDVSRARAMRMWRRVSALDGDLTRFAFERQGSGPAGPRVQQEIVQAGSRSGTEVTVLSEGDTGLRAIQREVEPNSTHVLD